LTTVAECRKLGTYRSYDHEPGAVMKSDAQLHADVAEELTTDPSIDARHIAVAVHDGAVTLTGTVPSFWQKVEAEAAVRRVTGVKAIANELKVEVPVMHRRDDTDIAEAAARALSWHSDLPDSIKATVTNGWVTLSGTVDWQFQKTEAERAVKYLSGVVGVTSNITIKATPKVSDVRERIRRELERTVEQEVDHIQIESQNGSVVLRGSVHSWADLEAAKRAAWSVPGVTNVENHLVVA
jgi:osmotically-inducible protein OsmY